jgi:hypothetical protein
LGQILESDILVVCDSVLQELSTNIFDYTFWQKYGHLNVQNRDNRNFTKSKKCPNS